MRRYLLGMAICLCLTTSLHAQPLPGTKPLAMQGDLAKQMVEGIDRYLTRATAASVEKRKAYWKPDFTSLAAAEKSVSANRERFRRIIGVIDPRLPVRMEYVASPEQSALVAQHKLYKVYAVRWPVLVGVDGEGLLLEPTGPVKANIIAIPDADQTPEMLVGLAPGVAKNFQYARQMAEIGCRVVVPTIIDRKDTWSGNPRINRMTNQPHREFIYRMAYQMGRHVIGYEVQRVLAVVDWFGREQKHAPIGAFGYGEGALIAYYSAASDNRIHSVVLSGYFAPRENLHDEPIYRNVWGLLREFGDADLAQFFLGKAGNTVPLVLEDDRKPPDVSGPPLAQKNRGGAAPGKLTAPSQKSRGDESYRAHRLVKGIPRVVGFSAADDYAHHAAELVVALSHDGFGRRPAPPDRNQQLAVSNRMAFDPESRQKRQFDQLVDHTQKLMPDAVQRRQEFFWNKLDTSSLDKFKKSQEPLRQYFHENIIGKLPEPTMPLNPRTRLHHETPKYKAYEVVLDVYEDVFSYGILCVPNDLKPGEKRPVVVCQHGLEGRPTDVVNPKMKTPYYNSFGSQLADQGFIVFAPQNPYIFKNEFRQTVRKANPLQLSLYSFIVRQHQRILEWLGTLPFVDATRIAYYGLSYGGKVAMRIPAILEGYCLSICSGDFNEWIWKNINLEWGGSYMFTGEYEMYEFDLGNTFNYAEMAALIAPRPFMVERGHNDGVGLDEYVAFEYAKVRRFYAKLGIADSTEIEFFTGGHECRVVGTLAFLRKHLNWPAR